MSSSGRKTCRRAGRTARRSSRPSRRPPCRPPASRNGAGHGDRERHHHRGAPPAGRDRLR
ncbi:hypothetical protein FW320_12620 [Azospirillum sp. Vi22]|nr:hypothetical protein [Azospirillum baldaniorum]